ncbi:MAG: hypothetical protein GY940_18700 [bacterium]|nr:hypothetical protein [bacterium]
MVDFSFVPDLETIVDIIESQYDRTPKWLNYLPAIFHEEGDRKRSPLWTLLLLMEDNFKTVSDKIEDIDRYFDIDRAPDGDFPGEEDFLSWIASWVELIPEQHWPEEKKRYAVRQAPHLYKHRGTITGLSYMLTLFFGIDVEVREWTWPRAMQIGVRSTIGVDTRLVNRPDINHCFVVIWKPEIIGEDIRDKIRRIRDLIDREKPVHTLCYFHVDVNGAVKQGKEERL